MLATLEGGANTFGDEHDAFRATLEDNPPLENAYEAARSPRARVLLASFHLPVTIHSINELSPGMSSSWHVGTNVASPPKSNGGDDGGAFSTRPTSFANQSSLLFGSPETRDGQQGSFLYPGSPGTSTPLSSPSRAETPSSTSSPASNAAKSNSTASPCTSPTLPGRPAMESTKRQRRLSHYFSPYHAQHPLTQQQNAASPSSSVQSATRAEEEGAPRKAARPTLPTRSQDQVRQSHRYFHNTQRHQRLLADLNSEENEWWFEDATQHGNIGLFKAVKDHDTDEIIYIGTPGFRTDGLLPEAKNEIEEKYWDQIGAIPVWLTDPIFQNGYQHYCKQVLWPAFHYLLPEYPRVNIKQMIAHSKAWQDFVKMNQLFADSIVDIYRPGDLDGKTVWVNDYHLLLVPMMIRKKIPDANIGYFHHIPWCSSEVFRCLASCKELIEGVLGADMIGLQTPSFVRHFLHSCSRTLGVDTSAHGVVLNDTFVSVQAYPIGIQPATLVAERRRPEVLDMIANLRDKYRGKKIIVGRDKVDPVKGVRQKLQSFELFLKTHPEWVGRVVLIQVALPNYTEADAQLYEVVNRINGQWGTLEYTPVMYLNQDIPREHYLALFSVADCCLITSLRDGMNCTSHEYVLCQDEMGTCNPLILSEFAGTVEGGFDKAIRVNPHDFQETADAILHALTMSDAEKEKLHATLVDHVLQHTGHAWTSAYLDDLVKIARDVQARFRLAIPHLSVETCLKHFDTASHRVCLLNYDGVLFAYQRRRRQVEEGDVALDPYLQHLLTTLTACPNMTVFINSGMSRAALAKLFSAVPALGLSAENGCFIKWPHEETWHNVTKMEDVTWREQTMNIFDFYQERTPGSYIEVKEVGIVWHYAAAEQTFGAWQARECQNHIMDIFEDKYPIHVVHGHKCVEVTPVMASQKHLCQLILARWPDTSFCLAFGEDRACEELYRYLRGDWAILPHRTALTCTVGNKSAAAEFFATNVAEVVALLGALVGLARPTMDRTSRALFDQRFGRRHHLLPHESGKEMERAQRSQSEGRFSNMLARRLQTRPMTPSLGPTYLDVPSLSSAVLAPSPDMGKGKATIGEGRFPKGALAHVRHSYEHRAVTKSPLLRSTEGHPQQPPFQL